MACFYPRDASYHGYQLSSCVRLSICLSQVDVLLKRLNEGSRKQRHMIDQDSPETRQNSSGVSPNGGAKCRWVRLNAGTVAANWRLSCFN